MGMKRGAKDVLGGIQDTIGALSGDVMAKKRVGTVVDGRRVIGRANIHFNQLLRPPTPDGMLPVWIKLMGGLMGSQHAGDVLVGLEMMKVKYAPQVPLKKAAPAANLLRESTLTVAIAGLRGIKVPEGYQALNKPQLEIVV